MNNMTTIIKKVRNDHPYIDFNDFDRKYSLFERGVKSIFFYFQKTRPLENQNFALSRHMAENKISGPIPLDPHEKVNMDAEKIMWNTWDFEFMVKKT